MSDRPAAWRAVGEYAWRVAPNAAFRLSEAIRTLGAVTSEDVARISSLMHDPGLRHETAVLLERWRASDAGSPSELAALLCGAAEAVATKSTTESADLVWSGPTSQHAPVRRLDEALLEVVHGARRVLTLLTFAAYRIPEVCSALERALDQGLEVRFIGETKEASEGSLRFDGSLALGQLASRVRLFEWPRELRIADRHGLVGRLHAKCAIADDAILLISSANLTEAALDANMEMGVLLRGGALPRVAASHFEDLIRFGILRERHEERL